MSDQSAARRANGVRDRPGSAARPWPRRLILAAVLLGMGLGGFFDGIVLHQILQWHHLISTPVPPVTLEELERNTLADGLFHLLAWVLTVAGVFVLATADGARTAPGGGRVVVGGLLVGWGLFNTVEGLIDHQLLAVHHVRAGPDELLYDLAFLAWGAAMLVVGAGLVRAGARLGQVRAGSPSGW